MAYKVVRGKLVATHSKTVKNRYSMGYAPVLKEVLSPPEPSQEKGAYMGLCNRSACLAPGANWYNKGSLAYYCKACAYLINHEGCRRYGEPDLCHLVGSKIKNFEASAR